MTASLTIPLSPLQQRDMSAWLAQKASLEVQMNALARNAVAGAGVDPDTLGGCSIDISNPSVGIVITPPAVAAVHSPTKKRR